MKSTIGIIADPHLSDQTIDQVERGFDKAISHCIQRKVKTVFIVGDIFTDRKSLSFEVLQCFDRILKRASEADLDIHMFPGNHDKISYISRESYLDVFRFHPSVTLYDEVDIVNVEGRNIFILPFFEEKNSLTERLNFIEKNKDMINEDSILLTHIAIDGVKNNDGSEVEGIVNRKVFKGFKRVLVGHYHDKQEIDNVLYIGSLLQNNYGENELKGISFLHSDNTIEQVAVQESKYLTVPIDLKKFSVKEIRENLISIYKDTGDRVRFVFEGDRDQLDLINKQEFTSIGIDVSYKEILSEEEISKEAIEFGGFNNTKILQEWDDYWILDDIQKEEFHEQGKVLLKEVLR